MTTDRRTMLLVFGLALAVTVAAAAAAQAPDPTPPRLKAGDQWNHGDDPWDPHPGNYVFRPEKVGIIHIELLDGFQVKVTRLHYDSLGTDTDRSWGWNHATAVKVIDWLNNEGEKPNIQNVCPYKGLKDFVFGQPHHVVVYIKNKNIKYPPRPLWFGNSLQGTVKNQVGPSRENHSFFKAEVMTTTGESEIKGSHVSKQFIYVQNHFHKYSLLSGHDPIQVGELRVYSMKISIISQSVTGDSKKDSEIPIIIDPDTGNMGGGAPLGC